MHAKKPAGQAGFGSVFHPSTLRGEFSTHRVSSSRRVTARRPLAVTRAGISSTADPENLTESDFYALDPARVTANGRLAVTRLLDEMPATHTQWP